MTNEMMCTEGKKSLGGKEATFYLQRKRGADGGSAVGEKYMFWVVWGLFSSVYVNILTPRPFL